MKIKLVIAIIVLSGNIVLGQDFSSFYSYVLNKGNINPAFTGNTNSVDGVLNSRSQFTGVSGSPKNIMFGVSAPVFANQGAGFKVINDSRGVFDVTRADFSYSHKVSFNDDVSLRFGLSVGILNRKINVNNLESQSSLFDSSDPTVNNSTFNYSRFVSGFGLLMKAKDFEIGFSAPHIIESATDINQYLVGMVSYDYSIEDTKWGVQPTLIYQNIPVTQNIVDVLVKGTWNDKISLIMGYANNNRIKGGMGLNLNGFGVSYLYEHSTGDLRRISGSTHEIMLSVSVKRQPKRFGTLKLEKDLDEIITYIADLVKNDANHGKDFIGSEIDRIHAQLNEILDENTDKNAGKVAEKLQRVEEQINLLIEKYKLN